jgi:hypothetical protein
MQELEQTYRTAELQVFDNFQKDEFITNIIGYHDCVLIDHAQINRKSLHEIVRQKSSIILK